MDNREVTLPNLSMLKTNKELIFPVAEKTIKIVDQDSSRSDGNVIKTEDKDKDIADKNDNPRELMMSAKKIFVEKFENASVEEKQAAITQFYSAIDSPYRVFPKWRLCI